MNHEPTVAPADPSGEAPNDESIAEIPAKPPTAQRPATSRRGKTRGPSPDAEGGQPVDEMDLDGDGARQT